MFEVGVIAEFEAAHSLRGDFGPAARKHGHTYRVEVGVRAEMLQPDGTLLNITVLQAAVDAAIGALHYRDLDELDDLRDRNTTAEEVARYLWQLISPRLRDTTLDLLSVRVWESSRAYASYSHPLFSTAP